MKNLLIFLFFIPVVTYGNDIVWEGNVMSIGDRVEILEDVTGTLTYEEVVSGDYKNKFKPSENLILNLGYTDSFFWLRFTVKNVTKSNLLLELAQAGLPVADLYYRVKGDSLKHLKAGYSVKMKEKFFNSSYQVFALPPGKTECYIRLNSNSEPIPIHLHNQKNFELESTWQKIGYGIYLGLMIFVALYNLFLFISLRKKLYLFYALIVLIYICYSAAVVDGFIVYFVPKVDLKFLYTTIPAIGITLQTFYCLVFLEVKKFSLQTYKIVKGIIIYFAIWMIAKFFFAFPIVQPINTVNALLSFLTMGFVGVKVGTKGSKMGYYFAIAYFIYFMLVAVQALYINTGSPEYIGGLSYVAYATLIEAFLLSFLLSRRFKWKQEEIEKEKFEAQLKVIEKTRENERIIEGQKVELEKQVASRTAQLQEVNEELTSTNDRLMELNDYKESMTAMIVHDFKNLLNTVISFSETIPTTRRLQSIHNAGKYMHNLVMNILDVQKFESVSVGLSLGNHSIKKVVTEAIEQMRFLIEQKSINLTFSIANDFYSRFDYELILRVVVNILSNAVKYVDVNGNIDIYAERKGDKIMLSVKDDGIGIPADKIDSIFDKYTQINARKSGAFRSTGLGLTFCKMAVEAHEGEIGVNSVFNVGSNFFFTLPVLNGYNNGSSVIEKISFKEDKTIVLTDEEKERLKPFLEELKQWEVYDFSEISTIADKIAKIDNENIISWKNNLLKVLFSGNTESYKKFINQ